jgi:thioredoxin 1
VLLSAVMSCSGGNQSSLGLESRSLEKALASGKPTLADFGSTTCIPCKNMKATLEQLDPLYRDKVNIAIVIVDDEVNQEIVAHYQIMSIPTQFFFDSTGKVVARHIGEMEDIDIIAQFKKMGIE